MKRTHYLMLTFRNFALAFACLVIVSNARAEDKKFVLTGSPAAQRLAKVHKVFLGIESGQRDDLSQSFYNALSAKLQKDNGYQLVDDPKDAEMLLYLSIEPWNAHLTMVDAESRVIVWSLTAWVTGWHLNGNGNQVFWLGQEAKGSQSFSDDLKALAGTAPSPTTKENK